VNDEYKYFMSSLSRALEILDLLSKHSDMKAIEISKELSLNKSSTFKMLYTLEKNKYVSKSENGLYSLGIKFALYGTIVLEKYSIRSLAKPFLEELRNECNETVHLGVLDEDLNVIFIAKESSKASVRMASKEGIKMPFYLTALGKVLVANHLNEQMIEKIKTYDLKKSTDNTNTDHAILLERLYNTKKQGYGEDLEENEEGLISFSAPINNPRGETIAAVSISGPAYRVNNNKENLIALIKDTAQKISETMIV
jgi:DNA-binding IclR family transcriptional regulator